MIWITPLTARRFPAWSTAAAARAREVRRPDMLFSWKLVVGCETASHCWLVVGEAFDPVDAPREHASGGRGPGAIGRVSAGEPP
jgi:hypothetical protein